MVFDGSWPEPLNYNNQRIDKSSMGYSTIIPSKAVQVSKEVRKSSSALEAVQTGPRLMSKLTPAKVSCVLLIIHFQQS